MTEADYREMIESLKEENNKLKQIKKEKEAFE